MAGETHAQCRKKWSIHAVSLESRDILLIETFLDDSAFYEA